MLRLDLSKNQLLTKEGGRAVGNMLKTNTTLKELDVSDSGNGMINREMDAPGFANEIIEGLTGNGAISSVNLLQNSIGLLQAKALVNILNGHPTLKSLCGNKGDVTELDMRGKMRGAADAIMLAAEIVGNGALTKFNISSNSIMPEGIRVLAEALRDNQVITELNLSSSSMAEDTGFGVDVSGVIALTDVIPGMRALMKLTFGDKQVVTMTTKMTEANFGGKLRSCEAQIVAAFLPKCT
jgi:hypothetical protein